MEFETYRKLDAAYSIGDMKQDNPTCFNGMVRVKKYRVTIEEINEPIEVIQKRLQKLWDKSNNWHNWDPLQAEAKKYGLELTHK